MRRAELMVAMLLAVILVSGCTTVPTSGGVERHQAQQDGVSAGVQVAPLPPTDGATQLLVVEGFLHAMSTYETGYQTARRYLTDQAAKDWHPESGVQVYADGYPPTETDQTVVLIAPLTGSIDPTGVYSPANGQLRQDFGLVKNDDGQWRIARPPEGLVVSRYLFTTGFASVDVHFKAAHSAVLLPEPRYFPVGERAVTDAAAAVLAGPSQWLAPAAAVAAQGVKLLTVGVDSTGLAVVSLGGAASSLSQNQREDLLAEFAYTLASFAEVSGVQVDSDGEVWTNSAGETRFTPASFVQLDPGDSAASRLAHLVKDGKLQRQAVAGSWADFGVVQAGLPKVESLAISRDLETWAVVSDDQTKLLSAAVGASKSRQLRSGKQLLRPFFSRTGDLWSPKVDRPDSMQVFRDGESVSVTVRGAPNRSVVAAAIAPDGSRLALVLASGGTTTLGLMRVTRTESGVIVDGWRELDLSLLGVSSSKLLDVGWNSITDLALLRTDSELQSSVIVLSQDGAQLSDIGPSDSFKLDSMLVVPGRPAMVLSSTGGLYRFDGEFNWLIGATEVEAAAYSG